MFETLRLQIPNSILFRYSNLAGLIGDFANPGDVYTVDSLGQPGQVIRPHGEQQLEVFAAMKSEHQRIEGAAAAQLAYVSIDWQSGRIK